MEITSKTVAIKATPVKLFSFLSDANNIIHLLPQDKISDWQSDKTSCSFKVQKAVTISLLQKELNPFETIVMESGEKSPFPFSLTININKTDEENSSGFIYFDGEVNSFLKMMVQTPLTNLFNHMAEELKLHFEEQI